MCSHGLHHARASRPGWHRQVANTPHKSVTPGDKHAAEPGHHLGGTTAGTGFRQTTRSPAPGRDEPPHSGTRNTTGECDQNDAENVEPDTCPGSRHRVRKRRRSVERPPDSPNARAAAIDSAPNNTGTTGGRRRTDRMAPSRVPEAAGLTSAEEHLRLGVALLGDGLEFRHRFGKLHPDDVGTT